LTSSLSPDGLSRKTKRRIQLLESKALTWSLPDGALTTSGLRPIQSRRRVHAQTHRPCMIPWYPWLKLSTRRPAPRARHPRPPTRRSSPASAVAWPIQLRRQPRLVQPLAALRSTPHPVTILWIKAAQGPRSKGAYLATIRRPDSRSVSPVVSSSTTSYCSRKTPWTWRYWIAWSSANHTRLLMGATNGFHTPRSGPLPTVSPVDGSSNSWPMNWRPSSKYPHYQTRYGKRLRNQAIDDMAC